MQTRISLAPGYKIGVDRLKAQLLSGFMSKGVHDCELRALNKYFEDLVLKRLDSQLVKVK